MSLFLVVDKRNIRIKILFCILFLSVIFKIQAQDQIITVQNDIWFIVAYIHFGRSHKHQRLNSTQPRVFATNTAELQEKNY
jgi:hypothetical protein